MVIGLTGGIGSGKTIAAGMFKELGVDVVYADQVGRDLLDNDINIINQVVSRYGNKVLVKNNKADKPRFNKLVLRNIIFNNENEKIWLEELLHPLINQNIIDFIQASKTPYCILEAAILIESRFHKLVDKVLVIDCSEQEQISRVLLRDKGISEQDIKQIIKSQLEREERKQHADYLIENNGSMEALRARVLELHQMFLGIKPTK